MADNTITRGQSSALGVLDFANAQQQAAQEVGTPVSGVEDLSGLDRSKLDLELARPFTTENDAKATILLHIAQQMNVPPNTINDDVAIKNYFGIGDDESFDVEELYNVLGNVAKTRIDDDDYSSFAMLDRNTKLEEAKKYYGEQAGDDEVAPAPQSGLSEDVMIELYESNLRNSSKREWLKYIDTTLNAQPSSKMRQFAEKSLMTRNINMVQYNQLSAVDKAFLADYISIANPEESVGMLERAGIRTKQFFKDRSGSLYKAAQQTAEPGGHDGFDGKYVYSLLSEIDPNWESMFDSKGGWKQGNRNRMAKIIADARTSDWTLSYEGAQATNLNMFAGSTIEKKRSEYLSDTLSKIDSLYTLAKSGQAMIKEQTELYDIRNRLRRQFEKGDGIFSKATDFTIDSAIPVVFDLATVAVLGRINPKLALLYSGAAFKGDFSEELEYKYGFSKRDAEMWSSSVAVPYAIVETLQAKKVAEGTAIGFRALFSKAYRQQFQISLKEAMKATGKDFAKDYISEMTEEAIQGAMEKATIAALEHVRQKGNVDERELIDEYGDEMLAAAVGIFAATGGSRAAGAGMNVATDFMGTGNMRAMLDKWAVDTLENRVRTNISKSDMTLADEINLIKESDMRLYMQADSASKKLDILEDAGLSNPAAALEIIDDSVKLREIQLNSKMREAGVDSIISIEQQEAALEDMRSMMAQEGFSVEVVDRLTGMVDELDVANVDDARNIEILSDLTTPERLEALRHERAHVIAEDLGVVTPEEQAFLKSGVDKLTAELDKAGIKTDTIYKDMAEDKKFNEAVADSIAVLNPQERTAFQKVREFFEKVYNFAKGKGFNSLRSVLKSIEERGAGRLRETAGDAVQAKKDKAERQARGDVDEILSEENLRFMRRERGPVQDLQDAAEQYALARVEGRNAQATAERLAEQTGRTAQDIAARGEQLFTESTERLQKGATRLEKRIAVRTVAQRAAIAKELRAARKEGATVAKKAQAAKKEVETAEQKKLTNALARAKSGSVSAAKMKQVGLDMSTLPDAAMLYKNVDTLLREMSVDPVADITDNADAIMQRRATISNVLADFVNKNVSNRYKWGLLTSIDKMGELVSGDSEARIVKALEKQIGAINDRIAEQRLLGDKATLKGMVKSILKGDKKNARTKLFTDKKVDEKTRADLENIAKAMRMKAEKADSVIDTALDLIDEIGNVDDLGNLTKATVEKYNSITKVFPNLSKLSAMDAARSALFYVNRFGNVADMSEASVADAIVQMDDMIKNGRFAINERIEELNVKVADQRYGLEAAVNNIIERHGADERRIMFSELNGLFEYLELIRDGGTLSKDQEAAYNRFIIELNSARQDRQGIISEAIYSLNEMLRNTMTLKRRKEVSEMRDDLRKYDNNNQPTSLANLLNVWLEHQQQDVIEEVEQHRKAWMNKRLAGEEVDKPGIVRQADQISAIEKELGNDLLTIGRFMRSSLVGDSDRTRRLNDKHREVTAADIDLKQDYWPNIREGSVSVAKGGNLGLFKGFLKDRTGSGKAMSTQMSAFDVAQKHIADAETFIAFADLYLSTKNSFLEPEMMKRIRLAIGRGSQTDFTDMLADELNGGPLIKGSTVPLLDAITSVIVHKGLFGNIFSGAKQIADVNSPAALLPGYMKYLAQRGTDKVRAASNKMLEHPALKARARDGYNQHTAEAIEESRGLGAGRFKQALKWGMSPTQKGDYASVWLGAGPAYLAALELPHIASIEDAKARDKAAMDMAVLLMERTLQSPHKTDRPHYIARGGSAARFLSIFSTALTPKVAQILKEVDAWRLAGGGLNTSNPAVKRLVRKLATYHLVGATLQWAISVGIQLGFTDDELDSGEFWELLATMVMGPWAGVPLLGIAFESAMSGVGGGMPRSDVQSGLARDVYNVTRKTTRFVEHMSEAEYNEAMEGVFDMLFNTLPPTRKLKQAYDKWLAE